MELKSEISLELVSQGYIRGSKEFKRAYRKRYHEKNKDRENEKNKKRYHDKYKLSEDFKEKKKEYWKQYVETKPSDWRKEYSSTRWKHLKSDHLKHKAFLKRHSELAKENGYYKNWYYENHEHKKQMRRDYAKGWRRKTNPSVGLKSAIADARRSGSIDELVEILESRIDGID